MRIPGDCRPARGTLKYHSLPRNSGCPLGVADMRPVGRTSSLTRSTCGVIAASALLTFLARANGPAIAAQARDCDKAVGVVASVDGVPKGIRALIDRRVTKASALLRFHRRDDSLAQMDAVPALLDGT